MEFQEQPGRPSLSQKPKGPITIQGTARNVRLDTMTGSYTTESYGYRGASGVYHPQTNRHFYQYQVLTLRLEPDTSPMEPLAVELRCLRHAADIAEGDKVSITGVWNERDHVLEAKRLHNLVTGAVIEGSTFTFGPKTVAAAVGVLLLFAGAGFLWFRTFDTDPGLDTDSPAPSVSVPRSNAENAPAGGPERNGPRAIPDVTSLPSPEAVARLKVAGFRKVETFEFSSDSVPTGRVIETNPDAGTAWPTDNPVTVVVSSGRFR